MYEKCISCERLGKDCFPNLCVMEMEDIRTWAKLRLKYKGWTYADLSEASGVPKGTIAYSFSQKGVAVNYSTFAPVLCALIDCPPGEYPCPEPSVEVSLLQEKYSQLEQENGELKLRANEAEGTHREDIRTTKAEKQKTIGTLKQDLKFCQEQILHKDRVIKQCKTKQACGIENFHPHKLRHTFASLSISEGADIASVSEILGHADKNVTLKIYTHSNQERMRKVAQKFHDSIHNNE